MTFEPALNDDRAADLFTITQLGEQARKAQAGDWVDIPKSALAAGGSAQGARPKFWAFLKDDGKSAIVGDYEKAPPGFTACLVNAGCFGRGHHAQRTRGAAQAASLVDQALLISQFKMADSNRGR